MNRLVTLVAVGLVLCAILIATATSNPSVTAQTGKEATIESFQTQVAELKATSTARGRRINAQRTQIAELKTQVANLEAQLPPTLTPTPELSGKDAYTWLPDPREILTRPGQHIGEKYAFCGTILSIQVAGPGNSYFVGDDTPKPYTTITQIYPDGSAEPFAVGFNGDSTGMYEDSYVCVWGTLVDTFSGTNSFGGTIVNPLFDAEYMEFP